MKKKGLSAVQRSGALSKYAGAFGDDDGNANDGRENKPAVPEWARQPGNTGIQPLTARGKAQAAAAAQEKAALQRQQSNTYGAERKSFTGKKLQSQGSLMTVNAGGVDLGNEFDELGSVGEGGDRSSLKMDKGIDSRRLAPKQGLGGRGL